jgi:cation diffusion facilitator family transporter
MAGAPLTRPVRLIEIGLLANFVLAGVKFVAGLVGNSYALIADAVESVADLFGSLIVWGGLRIAARDPDADYPFGYGKAEAVAAGVVGMLLVAAAVALSIEAVREILTPHHAPEPYTLVVLVAVVALKWILARRVRQGAKTHASRLMEADAAHHLSDAITSAAAFVGISVALIGGPGWEAADDVAALVASAIILINGWRIVRPAVRELLDRSPEDAVLDQVDRAARSVPEVRATEKLRVRSMGNRYLVEVHVQSDPSMSLHAAHIVSGKVKSAIRAAVPDVRDVLVHMEPFEP